MCEVRSFVFGACVKEKEREREKRKVFSHCTSLSSKCLSFSNRRNICLFQEGSLKIMPRGNVLCTHKVVGFYQGTRFSPIPWTTSSYISLFPHALHSLHGEPWPPWKGFSTLKISRLMAWHVEYVANEQKKRRYLVVQYSFFFLFCTWLPTSVRFFCSASLAWIFIVRGSW